MARFEDYERHKAYWFMRYLNLAVAISADPSLSAKNFDLKEYMDEYVRIAQQMERIQHRGWFYDKE